MSRTVEERFWAKVDKTGDCWLWTGCTNAKGYGSFAPYRKAQLAHRVAWELANGAIPAGLEINHLCRIRNCVNHTHLELVTHRENVRRSPLLGRGNAKKTHCPQGHSYDEENTYHRPGSGKTDRGCLVCRRHQAAASRAKKEGTK